MEFIMILYILFSVLEFNVNNQLFYTAVWMNLHEYRKEKSPNLTAP